MGVRIISFLFDSAKQQGDGGTDDLTDLPGGDDVTAYGVVIPELNFKIVLFFETRHSFQTFPFVGIHDHQSVHQVQIHLFESIGAKNILVDR